MRAFFEAHRTRRSTASLLAAPASEPAEGDSVRLRLLHSLPPEFVLTVSDLSVYHRGRAGLSIAEPLRPGAAASASVRMVDAFVAPDDSPRRIRAWVVNTTNVARLSWRPPTSYVSDGTVDAMVEEGTLRWNEDGLVTAATSHQMPQVFVIDGIVLAARSFAASDVCLVDTDESVGDLNKRLRVELRSCPKRADASGVLADAAAAVTADGEAAAANTQSHVFYRTPSSWGPIRLVTAVPFAIVIGTQGAASSDAKLASALARAADFLSCSHALAFDTFAPIVRDVEVVRLPGPGEVEDGWPVPPDHNLILLGGVAWNAVTQCVLAVLNGTALRSAAFGALRRDGVASIAMLPNGGSTATRLALLLEADDAEAWVDLMKLV
jgi:hypothetical protein